MLRQGGACLGTPECQVLSTKGQKIPVNRQRMSVGQARAVSVLPDVSGAVRSTLHFHANHCMFMHISLLLDSVEIPPCTAGETRIPGNGLQCLVLCLELHHLWHGTMARY